MPKTILFLLAAIVLPHAGSMRADEPAPIIRGESHQPGEFCIRISGALANYTGYLHSSQPFTLQQAIEGAGGLNGWAGNIKIYPDERREPISRPTKIISVREYSKDVQARAELLPTGTSVYVEARGHRF